MNDRPTCTLCGVAEKVMVVHIFHPGSDPELICCFCAEKGN